RYVLSYYPLTSLYLDSHSVPGAPYLNFMNWSMASGRLDTGTTRTPPLTLKSMLSGTAAFSEVRPKPMDRVFVYKNVCALPRVFSVETVVFHESEEAVLRYIATRAPAEFLWTAHVAATSN